MTIQVFKTECNSNTVDTVNPFLGAVFLKKQERWNMNETSIIGMFDHICPILTNQGSISTVPFYPICTTLAQANAASSSAFSASRPTFGYEGLQVPRLDNNVFLKVWVLKSNTKRVERKTDPFVVFCSVFWKPSPAIWQVLLQVQLLHFHPSLITPWEGHRLIVNQIGGFHTTRLC